VVVIYPLPKRSIRCKLANLPYDGLKRLILIKSVCMKPVVLKEVLSYHVVVHLARIAMRGIKSLSGHVQIKGEEI